MSTSSLSSVSSESSLSSSSESADNGYSVVRFTYDCIPYSPVGCFTRLGSYVYAGTGPHGKVLRSLDLKSWRDFKTIESGHVRSIIGWANGLFMGMEPSGRIYIHNFSTGNFYCAVQTEDQAVTCFASYNGKLYAGTSPRGVIYCFDGNTWSVSLRSIGRGVTSLAVYDNQLYAGAIGLESPLVFNNVEWKLVSLGIDPQKKIITSTRGLSSPTFKTSDYEVININQIESVNIAINSGEMTDEDKIILRQAIPEISIGSLSADSHLGLLIGGGTYCRIYAYHGDTISLTFSSDAAPVTSIVNIKDSRNVFAAGETLYLMADDRENPSSSEST